MPVKQHEKDMNCDGANNNGSYLQTMTIAVFGDCRVGKTTLILRFLGSELPEEYCPTIEEYYSTQFFYQNKSFSMSIIESSGHYEFPAMRRIAIEKADAFLLVYSADNPTSFLKLNRYLEEIKDSGKSHYPIIVVSNRLEEIGTECGSSELKNGAAQQLELPLVQSYWGLKWQECSLSDITNVEEIFCSLLQQTSREEKRKKRSRPSRKLSALLALTKKKMKVIL